MPGLALWDGFTGQPQDLGPEPREGWIVFNGGEEDGGRSSVGGGGGMEL